LGFKPMRKTIAAEEWVPAGADPRATGPFEGATIELTGAELLPWATRKVPLIPRHRVGDGAVIVTLCPRMLGQDERAHPALPYLMNGLTDRLIPIEVVSADGARLRGELMYQVNRTKDGYLVLLVNNRGVDKTQ